MSTATLWGLWTDPTRADRLGRRHAVAPAPPPVAQPSPVWLEGRWRAWSERSEEVPAGPTVTAPRARHHWVVAALSHVHVPLRHGH